jgi:hypothetical protein
LFIITFLAQIATGTSKMQYQIITKMVEEYLIASPIKMEEVDKVIGRPTFTKFNLVTVALKTNCIAMEDPRSRVGRLHCIVNSQHIEQGGIGIPPSENPGPLTFVGLLDTLARENYMLDHTQHYLHNGKTMTM